MKRFCSLAILFLLAFAAQSFAQSKLPPNMFYEKLKNGLDVLVIEDHTVPLATIMITVKTVLLQKSPALTG